MPREYRRPAVGKMVHYVELDERTGQRVCRAAWVVSVWPMSPGDDESDDDEQPDTRGWVDLWVLLPGALAFHSGVDHEESETAVHGPGKPGTWHWPEPD